MPPILGVVERRRTGRARRLRPGDLVIAVDGTPIRSFNEFADYVRARPARRSLLTVRRDGSRSRAA